MTKLKWYQYIIVVLLCIIAADISKASKPIQCYHFGTPVKVLGNYHYHHNQYYVEVDLKVPGVKRRYGAFKTEILCR